MDEPEQARAVPEARAAVLALLELRGTRVALGFGGAPSARSSGFPICPTASCSWARTASRSASTSRATESGWTRSNRGRSTCFNQVLGEVADFFDQVWLEPKPTGFALHTRLATDHNSRVAHLVALSEATAEVDNLTVRKGKDVLEFSVRSTTQGRCPSSTCARTPMRTPCSTPATT
ncbi:MAG: hypothetical protein WDM88_10435 [Galbitalea sp.]